MIISGAYINYIINTMKITKKQIISLLILTIMAMPLLFVTQARAGLIDSQYGLDEVGYDAYGENDERATDIRIIVAEVIQVILTLLGSIFLILVVLAGFKWMIANGNEENIKSAKAKLSNALIGLVIILASWSITYFVLGNLTNVVERIYSPL